MKNNKKNCNDMIFSYVQKFNKILHKANVPDYERVAFAGTMILYLKKYCQSKDLIWKEQSEDLFSQIQKDDIFSLSITNNIKDTLKSYNINSDVFNKVFEYILSRDYIYQIKEEDWKSIINFLLENIVNLNTNTLSVDIIDLFFSSLRKYSRRKDRNQVFTPNHIGEFIMKVCEVNKNDVILDPCCGSCSFLTLASKSGVPKRSVFGIENDMEVYRVAVINLLLNQCDPESVKYGSCFDNKEVIQLIKPTFVFMNPPYNANPRNIPDTYKYGWKPYELEASTDPTKGLVFVEYIANTIKEADLNNVKIAAVLPVACAIGITNAAMCSKHHLLDMCSLDAVCSLPIGLFYPGAAVETCIMFFTANPVHQRNKLTFFGYFKEDGFVKKRGVGRIPAYDTDGNTLWPEILKTWVDIFINRLSRNGLSVNKYVTADDEWLAEAYMQTDLCRINSKYFEETVKMYLSYMIGTED